MTEKRCSKCREVKLMELFHNDRSKPDGVFNQCKKCNNANSSRTRKGRNRTTPARLESNKRRARRYVSKNPEKVKARILYRKALSKGEITRQCCEVCGDSNSQGHHEDYSKPLEVVWLCRKHHMEIHYKIVSPL